MPSKKISAVIPVYNEAENIERVAGELKTLFDSGKLPYELIFINDGSGDATQEILNRLAVADNNIKFLRNEQRTGKSFSLLKGMDLVSGDIILIMDGDGQININDVSKILELIIGDEYLDIVIGSKYHPDSVCDLSPYRRLIGSSYNKLVTLVLGYNFTDIQAGMKALRTQSYRQLGRLKAKKFDLDLKLIAAAVEREMLIREVPISVKRREHGKSKVNKFFTSAVLIAQIIRIYFRQRFGKKNIYGNYQHRALASKNPVQRFWHRNKSALFRELDFVSPRDILLDAGCGSGNFCFRFAGSCAKVYGVDVFADAVNFASKTARRNKVQNAVFIEAPLEKIPLENSSVDKIFLVDVIEHLRAPGHAIKELRRVLRPGGKLAVITPNYASYWKTLENAMDLLNLAPRLKGSQHVTKFDIGTLSRFLEENGFKTEKKGSIYSLSPFYSIFSGKLADKAFLREVNSGGNRGALAYCIAVKP
jgi:glycosyltransferase involved in cell wall biosynthesis/precorrin-6B methylase 2